MLHSLPSARAARGATQPFLVQAFCSSRRKAKELQSGGFDLFLIPAAVDGEAKDDCRQPRTYSFHVGPAVVGGNRSPRFIESLSCAFKGVRPKAHSPYAANGLGHRLPALVVGISLAQFEIGRLASRPVMVVTRTDVLSGLITWSPPAQAPSTLLKPL